MNNETNISIVEAIVLASPEPVSSKRIADVYEDLTPSRVGRAVADLNNRYMESGSSFRIRELAGGFQFHIIPEFSGYVEELFSRQRKMRLTRAALETLSIVAYRQPVTKTTIEHIRGVASDGVLHNLLEKNLVTIRGRAATVGKALQYGTTNEFLKFFGLNQLEDLPQMGEIEELLKSRDPQNQTELDLPRDENAEVVQKLNVADGTFDPDQWDESGESGSDEQDGTGGPPLVVDSSCESMPTINGGAPSAPSIHESDPVDEPEEDDENDLSEVSDSDTEIPIVIVDVDTT